jgi:hypothetical protein
MRDDGSCALGLIEMGSRLSPGQVLVRGRLGLARGAGDKLYGHHHDCRNPEHRYLLSGRHDELCVLTGG